MSKIKKIFLLNKKLISSLAPYAGHDFLTTGFALFPFNVINYALPLKFKMFQDAYLIDEDKKIKGFIALEREKGSRTKININKLFLNSNSLEYGEQLINYATSRYGAMGATTFNIKFDNSYEEIINLLVNNCKFRITSLEKIYKINDVKQNDEVFNYFFPFSNGDADCVANLEKSCINSYQLCTFQRNSGYFKDNLLYNLDSKTQFKYVFKSGDKKIQAYFCINSSDNKNYIVDLILDSAYTPYFLDILAFCTREVRKRNKNFSIYLRLNKYYENFNNLEEILGAENGIEFVKQNIILTKDYYVPAKNNETEGAIFFDALNLKPN